MHHLLVHFHFSMMGKCEPLLFLFYFILFYFIIIIITTPNMLTAELIDHFLVLDLLIFFFLVYAKVVPGSELCC